ncbi:MAG: hypothetical protein ACI35O_17105 [Bacillaceae bacterium]
MSVVAYRCPNCGADIHFNPELQTCKCEFCLSSFSVEELEAKLNNQLTEESVTETIEESVNPEEWAKVDENTTLYSCPNCGAQIITDSTTAATFCCYCHNPVVIATQLSGNFRPSKVIPFQLNKENAVEALQKWCKTKWFLPKDFSSDKQIEKMTGMYIPFWLADYELTGQVSANAKNIKTWRSGDYRYTKTDEYAVFRQADMNFNHVPQNGSTKADDKVMQSIEPFDYRDLKDFSLSYLSGFIAEKYDRDKDTVAPLVRERVEKTVQSVLRNTIQNYSTVQVKGVHTQVHKAAYHYTLLPIWMMTYHYRGDMYVFAMNGQTGKVFGSLPLCRKKLGMLFGSITAAVSVLGMIGGLFL